MLKFFKVLLQKLFKKKSKGKYLSDFLKRKQKSGDLPEGIQIDDVGSGVFRIKADSELSFDQITSLIEGFIRGEENE